METKYLTITIPTKTADMKPAPKSRKHTRSSVASALPYIVFTCTVLLLYILCITHIIFARNNHRYTVNTVTIPNAAQSLEMVNMVATTYGVSLTTTEDQEVAPQTTVAYEIPIADTGFKSYMDYRCITSPSSKQWSLQQDAWTDELGFRRYGDYYMVAMGTYYASECGKVFHIVLEDGGEFDAIIGDIKSNMHTDALHQHHNGNVVEFIVDSDCIPHICAIMGDMSYADATFQGKIKSIGEIQTN